MSGQHKRRQLEWTGRSRCWGQCSYLFVKLGAPTAYRVVQGDPRHILAAHAIPKRCPTTWSIKLSELVLNPMHIAEACLIASAAAVVVSAGCEAPQTANPLLTAHCDLWYPCTRTPCYTIWKPRTGTWRNRIGRGASINMIIVRPHHMFSMSQPQSGVRDRCRYGKWLTCSMHSQSGTSASATEAAAAAVAVSTKASELQQQQQNTFARCVCVALLTRATP